MPEVQAAATAAFDDFLSLVPIETGQNLPAQKAAEAMTQGGTLMRSEAGYHTAISVKKPRELDRIVTKVLNEANYAGKDFYYSWPVTDRKTGKKTIVEGPSIGAAMAVLREWGNCVLKVQVEEQGTQLLFTPQIIDLENGITIERAYKFRPTKAPGKYEDQRWEDMQFQVAQSKAIRNVIRAAMPSWLMSQLVERAKRAELNYIARVGLVESRNKAVEFFRGLGVEPQSIEAALNRPQSEWTSEDVVYLRNLGRQHRDGEIDLAEVFPPVAAPQASPEPQGGEANPNAESLAERAEREMAEKEARQKAKEAAAQAEKQAKPKAEPKPEPEPEPESTPEAKPDPGQSQPASPLEQVAQLLARSGAYTEAEVREAMEAMENHLTETEISACRAGLVRRPPSFDLVGEALRRAGAASSEQLDAIQNLLAEAGADQEYKMDLPDILLAVCSLDTGQPEGLSRETAGRLISDLKSQPRDLSLITKALNQAAKRGQGE